MEQLVHVTKIDILLVVIEKNQETNIGTSVNGDVWFKTNKRFISNACQKE